MATLTPQEVDDVRNLILTAAQAAAGDAAAGVQQQLQVVRTELDAFGGEAGTRFQAMETAFTALQSDTQRLTTGAQALEAKVQTAETLLSGASHLSSGMQNEVGAMKTRIQYLEANRGGSGSMGGGGGGGRKPQEFVDLKQMKPEK